MSIPHFDIPTYSSPEINPDLFNKYSSLNRLIIIGNGFDISHGLRSSFKDFIYNYCYNVYIQFLTKSNFNDRLISIKSELIFSNSNEIIRDLTYEKAFEFFNNLRNYSGVKFKIKSLFFEAILSEVETKKWVDIEMQYYDFLKRAISDKERVTNLNDDFSFIKNIFTIYLSEHIKAFSVEPNKDVIFQFTTPILPIETKPNTIKKNIYPDTICILNFNYTSIAEDYSKLIENNLYIPIHGKLTADGVLDQEPIFGFGDDMDPDYEKFEMNENEEIFKNIKSFKYLQFRHYRQLIEFIENKPYQVYIYGHSCGLTDRTLLNTIFENENCISIKPFYYSSEKGDDYESKTVSIARHFKSKPELRNKVVNKEACEPIVQSFVKL